MNNRVRYFFAICWAAAPLIGIAQDQTDALRYSETILGGTARFQAMGGAFTAVGGDMSTLDYNPAGIGVFNKNQVQFSMGFSNQMTTSAFNGMSSANSDANVNIQSGGFVATWKPKDKDVLWKNYNFGIAYNRTNNFNYNITTEGNNNSSSLLDFFTANAQGKYPNQLDGYYSGPAFNVGLLDTIPGKGQTQYFNIIDPYLNGHNYIQQLQNFSTSGSMGETDISFGGNYNNRLYIGASIGITDVMYNETINYTETPQYTDSAFGLQNYTFTSNLTTSGAGVNFKIGFIYRLFDFLRIGGAIHTPTIFYLNDTYSTTLAANFGKSPYDNDTAESPSYQSGIGTSSFTLTTPTEFLGGAALVLAQHCIISADYEYVDYSTASITEAGANFINENQAIKSNLMPASNLRAGFEYVLYPFSFRAGYAYYGNPYAPVAGSPSIRNVYSVGLGIKFNRVFLDVAYSLMMYNENMYLYNVSPTDQAVATNTTNLSNIVITLGMNFDNEQHKKEHRHYNTYPPPPPPPPPGQY
jgi:hypothetical protein